MEDINVEKAMVALEERYMKLQKLAQSKIDLFTSRQEDLNIKLMTLTQEKESVQVECRRLGSRLMDIERENRDLLSHVEKVESEHEAMRKLLENARDKASELQLELQVANKLCQHSSVQVEKKTHECDQIRSQLQKVDYYYSLQLARFHHLQHELAEKSDQCAELKSAYNAVINSTSWKSTAPFRRVVLWFRSANRFCMSIHLLYPSRLTPYRLTKALKGLISGCKDKDAKKL